MLRAIYNIYNSLEAEKHRRICRAVKPTKLSARIQGNRVDVVIVDELDDISPSIDAVADDEKLHELLARLLACRCQNHSGWIRASNRAFAQSDEHPY